MKTSVKPGLVPIAISMSEILESGNATYKRPEPAFTDSVTSVGDCAFAFNEKHQIKSKTKEEFLIVFCFEKLKLLIRNSIANFLCTNFRFASIM
ncbi:MAG: hypothetical protein IPG39_16195 [Bacteroidetes bacterium]|nr:hypothetical protein [Bacteroidota bacterium]